MYFPCFALLESSFQDGIFNRKCIFFMFCFARLSFLGRHYRGNVFFPVVLLCMSRFCSTLFHTKTFRHKMQKGRGVGCEEQNTLHVYVCGGRRGEERWWQDSLQQLSVLTEQYKTFISIKPVLEHKNTRVVFPYYGFAFVIVLSMVL